MTLDYFTSSLIMATLLVACVSIGVRGVFRIIKEIR